MDSFLRLLLESVHMDDIDTVSGSERGLAQSGSVNKVIEGRRRDTQIISDK